MHVHVGRRMKRPAIHPCTHRTFMNLHTRTVQESLKGCDSKPGTWRAFQSGSVWVWESERDFLEFCEVHSDVFRVFHQEVMD